MQVIRQIVGGKLIAYLRHEMTLDDLVGWAEQAMQEGEFEDADHDILRDIVSRLGVADVRSFGLTWEDCERFLQELGYSVRLEVVAQP